MSANNPIALLGAIETADIACTRSHYALLTDRETEERKYRSSDINGVWVNAETRDGKRVGHISGFGVTRPLERTTFEASLDWIRAEKPNTIRVQVALTVENAEVTNWLTDANFKQARRISQWSARTDVSTEPPATVRRRKTYDHDFSIREIEPELAGHFARIVAVNYRFKPGIDVGWWERQVGAPGYYTFLAFSGDEPIGTGMLQGSGKMCVFGYGTTLKVYRKKGVQNAMIAARLQKALELGCDFAAASTFGTDQSSRNLRRRGFVFAGEVGVYTFSPPAR